MVLVMRYAVVTHAWPARSLRSSAMTRMALATIVWSSAARNIPIISPTRIVTISLWESTGRGRGLRRRGVRGRVDARRFGGSSTCQSSSGSGSGRGGWEGPAPRARRCASSASPRERSCAMKVAAALPSQSASRPWNHWARVDWMRREDGASLVGERGDLRPPVATGRPPWPRDRGSTSALTCRLTVETSLCRLVAMSETRTGACTRDDEEHGVCRHVDAVVHAGSGVAGCHEQLLHAQQATGRRRSPPAR